MTPNTTLTIDDVVEFNKLRVTYLFHRYDKEAPTKSSNYLCITKYGDMLSCRYDKETSQFLTVKPIVAWAKIDKRDIKFFTGE